MTSDLIILFIVSFLAATISGAAGFGGALILLPILTGLVGVKAAVPILTIGQFFGNASRVWFNRQGLTWKPILFFIATAVPFTVLGSLLFTGLDSRHIKMAMGVFLIGMVVYRRVKAGMLSFSAKGMLPGGAVTGFLSGLIGSAGPLGAAFFFGLNLTPTAYIASDAFASLVMHLTKAIVYHQYSLIGPTELFYGLFISVAMIGGSWAGKQIVDRLSRDKFALLVELLLVVAGLQLIFTGSNVD